MRSVAVVIPGAMGSELSLGGKLIWPGSIPALLGGYALLDELLDERLAATDLIREYTPFAPQYGTLIRKLAPCGFREEESPPTLVPFPYDWRRPNEDSARALAARLEAVVDAHKGQAAITLIAHSMGGLVARYFLESPEFHRSAGCAAVRRLITLGTPHRGAPLALARLRGQERVLWLSPPQVRRALNDARYPSAYQLLPPPGEPFAWNEAAGREFAGIDPYDRATGADLGLTDAGLAAARDFHRVLDPARRPEGVRYFCFAGTQWPTPAVTRIRPSAADPRQLVVRNEDVAGSGDGVVPFWSATLPGVQSRAVGGEHSVLYKDRELLRTLGVLLGFQGLLEAAEGTSLTIRQRVVGPAEPLNVVLGVEVATSDVAGELRFEKANLDAVTGALLGHTAWGDPAPIQYAGAAVRTLEVVREAPSSPGLYRLVFQPVRAALPSAADEFVVQRS